MNNPFKKETHSGLITAVAAGALVSGALAYLYFTKSGKQSLRKTKHTLKEALKDRASEYGSKKTPLSQKTIKAILDKVL